jgi:hypothetical protein
MFSGSHTGATTAAYCVGVFTIATERAVRWLPPDPNPSACDPHGRQGTVQAAATPLAVAAEPITGLPSASPCYPRTAPCSLFRAVPSADRRASSLTVMAVGNRRHNLGSSSSKHLSELTLPASQEFRNTISLASRTSGRPSGHCPGSCHHAGGRRRAPVPAFMFS